MLVLTSTMKNFKHLLFLSILCSLVLFTNCSEDEDPVADTPTNTTDDSTDDDSTTVLDTDGDGVVDSVDQDNSTREGVPVDENGVMLNPIYLDENGYTIKSHDWGEVGDVGEIEGQWEFLIIDENELRERIINGGDLYNVVTTKITNMDYLFFDIVNEERYRNGGDVTGFDVSNVTSMEGTFKEHDDIGHLGHWDVSNVTNMSHLFESSNLYSSSEPNPYSLHNWDVSNVTDMSYMFSNVTQILLPFLDNWDVSNVTDMSFMFTYTSISDVNSFINWDVSNVVNMSNMFNSCDMDIPIGMWDVSNVENMEKMMYRISSYSTYGGEGYNLDNWDVNKVTNCSEFSYGRSHGFGVPNFTNCTE